MRTTLAAITALVLTGPAALHAQTIAPVIAEYKGKAHGKFVLVNPGLQPVSVVLEPMSFTVNEEGRATYSPLDPSIDVKLSTTSFRVGPREMYTVYYEASCERRPAWFTVYATITGPRPSGGLQVAVRLPHTVYLLTKPELARESIVLHGASLDSAGNVVAMLESRSLAFGRVKQVQVWSGKSHRTHPGLPVFPGQRRRLRIERASTETPDRMVLDFGRFQAACPISR